jgi:hypothetical protein
MSTVVDPNTCDHEWVDDGTLEVFPPVLRAHCRRCGLERRVNSATGATTYLEPTGGPPAGAAHSPSTEDRNR